MFGILSSGLYFYKIFLIISSSKILELEEELKVVGNNMKSLEVSEQEVETLVSFIKSV